MSKESDIRSRLKNEIMEMFKKYKINYQDELKNFKKRYAKAFVLPSHYNKHTELLINKLYASILIGLKNDNVKKCCHLEIDKIGQVDNNCLIMYTVCIYSCK